MKKAAFAGLAVLAVVVLSGSNLLSQSAPQEVASDVRDRERLAAQYVQLVQQKAAKMSEDELFSAIEQTKSAIERLEAEAALSPIIDQLRRVEQEHAGKMAGKKAGVAAWLLHVQDDSVLSDVSKVLVRDMPRSQAAALKRPH